MFSLQNNANEELLKKDGRYLIETYQSMVINHIKKNRRKYSDQNSFESLCVDLFLVKIKFLEFIEQKYDANFLRLSVGESEQLFVAAFFGIGTGDSIEKHIENHGLFWGHYLLYLQKNEFPSFHLNNYVESIKRFSRQSYGQKQRVIAFGIVKALYELQLEVVSDYSFSLPKLKSALKNANIYLKGERKKFSEYFEISKATLNQLTKGQTHIKIYRGFDFAPTDSVRKGLKLKNNPTAHIQETGGSLSFTPNTEVAKQFALAKWAPVSNASWNSRVRWSRLILQSAGVDIDKFLYDKERYAAVGTYLIAVKNITANLMHDLEEELVVLPEHIEKFSYKIIKGVKK
jgi:hypothetical protein